MGFSLSILGRAYVPKKKGASWLALFLVGGGEVMIQWAGPQLSEQTESKRSRKNGIEREDRATGRGHGASWRARLCALCVCSNNTGQLRVTPWPFLWGQSVPCPHTHTNTHTHGSLQSYSAADAVNWKQTATLLKSDCFFLLSCQIHSSAWFADLHIKWHMGLLLTLSRKDSQAWGSVSDKNVCVSFKGVIS